MPQFVHVCLVAVQFFPFLLLFVYLPPEWWSAPRRQQRVPATCVCDPRLYEYQYWPDGVFVCGKAGSGFIYRAQCELTKCERSFEFGHRGSWPSGYEFDTQSNFDRYQIFFMNIIIVYTIKVRILDVFNTCKILDVGNIQYLMQSVGENIASVQSCSLSTINYTPVCSLHILILRSNISLSLKS